MSFVYRCLAVNNIKKPFVSRCNNRPDGNHILCKHHIKEAKLGKVFVLMHKEITKKFKVPFKDQVCVSITLNNDLKKQKDKEPDRNKKIDSVKEVRNKMFETMRNWDIDRLKAMHDKLELNIWDIDKLKMNAFAFQYYVVKAIISKLAYLSGSSL